MAGTRAEFEGHTGVWVTSRGRHIFIRDGESITDSILRYNKEKGIKTDRHDIQASKYEYDKLQKQEKFINSVPQEIDEKEYNTNAKSFRDASDLESEYNNLYDNPNYYEDMVGTNRLKALAMKEPISDYVGKHESKKDVFDYAKQIRKSDNNPIQSMADDRIDDVETTLENNKWILNYMNNNGIDDFGGESKQDLEYKIARDEEYLKIAKAPQSDKITISKDDIAKKIAENNKKEAELISKGQTLYTTADKLYDEGNYNPMEEFSDTVGDGLSDLQRNTLKEVSNVDLEGYKYYTKHGMGPGMMPSDVELGDIQDYDDGMTSFRTNRPLSSKELNYYDIEDETKNSEYDKKYFDNEIGFVQEDSMYGGVIKEYTNKELKEMAERGIRPKKDSYGHPGAWEGINSDKRLSKKEIAKTVQDAMKKKYPNTKLTRSTSSGYADVEITISSSSEPIVVSSDDIDKMEFSQFGNLSTSIGFDRWAKDNVEGYSKRATYDINDVRNYAKTQLRDEFKGTRVSGNEWFLTPYGKNLVNDIQKELNSYNYDDSNGMVDYFDRGFYDDIQIGKWNKPYENTSYNKTTLTNENDDISAKVERFKKRKGKK